MTQPGPIDAARAPLRTRRSNYPEMFAARLSGREKRPLEDLFGLTHFGVNLVRLPSGYLRSGTHTPGRTNHLCA